MINQLKRVIELYVQYDLAMRTENLDVSVLLEDELSELVHEIVPTLPYDVPGAMVLHELYMLYEDASDRNEAGDFYAIDHVQHFMMLMIDTLYLLALALADNDNDNDN